MLHFFQESNSHLPTLLWRPFLFEVSSTMMVTKMFGVQRSPSNIPNRTDTVLDRYVMARSSLVYPSLVLVIQLDSLYPWRIFDLRGGMGAFDPVERNPP